MSMENQRITKKGFRYEILPSTEHSSRRVKDYNEYCTLYNRLAELEDKIENGTLVELPRIIHPNKQEWFVQFQYESRIIDCNIFYSKAEAEARLKELQEKQK